MSLQYNRATNRIITGGHTYDANGNLTAIPLLQMSYDALNRMTQATHDLNGTDQYAYDPWNRMVWNKQSSTEYVTYYGVFGEVLGRFRVSPEAGGQFAHERRRIYFGGRQILTDDEFSAKANVTDRLGSVRKGVVPGADSYYPFGEIKTGNGDTFATYTRNATSNLHYATNRWYSNQIARFTTPDPWGPSATPGDPQSWNRYAYVQNDPVNMNDPLGLQVRKLGDCYYNVTTFYVDGQKDSEEWQFLGCVGSGGGGGPAFEAQRRGPTDEVGGGGPSSTGSPADRRPAQSRPAWLNELTSLFGYDEKDPRPSCFEGFLRDSWSNLNPLSPSWASLGEPLGSLYGGYKFNQAIEYAATTPSRTFGTPFLVYPYRSSVFRLLLRQAASGSAVALVANGVLAEFQALVDEYRASRAGECQ